MPNFVRGGATFRAVPLLPLYVIRRALFRTRNPKSATQLKSVFRFQLQETKKLSLLYGNLSRTQIQNICNQAFCMSPGTLTEKVLSLLERRLDVVIFRAGFCKSLFQAKQWINHKKISVNGNLITIPGYQCKPGDILSCAKSDLNHVREHLETFYMTRRSNTQRFAFVNVLTSSPSQLSSRRHSILCKLMEATCSQKGKHQCASTLSEGRSVQLCCCSIGGTPEIEGMRVCKMYNVFNGRCTHRFGAARQIPISYRLDGVNFRSKTAAARALPGASCAPISYSLYDPQQNAPFGGSS